MTDSPYAEIEKVCPECGMRSVWFCTASSCPMKDSQTSARKKWIDSSENAGEDETKSS